LIDLINLSITNLYRSCRNRQMYLCLQ